MNGTFERDWEDPELTGYEDTVKYPPLVVQLSGHSETTYLQ